MQPDHCCHRIQRAEDVLWPRWRLYPYSAPVSEPTECYLPNPSTITHIHMKNANDPHIPVGMGVFAFFFVCEDHDISMRAWVEGILIAVQVVCGVIDLKNLMTIYSVLNEGDSQCVPFLCCELPLITVILTAHQP